MDPTLETDGVDEDLSGAPDSSNQAPVDGADEEVSLRDTIRNAVKEHSVAPEGETPEERSARIRDEKGRFVAADKATVDKTAKAPAAPKDSKDFTAQGETASQEPQVEIPGDVPLPRSWAAEDKDAFLALPPATRQRVAEKESKREAIFNQKTQELTESIALNQGIGPVIQPYVRDWKLRGIDPAVATDKLLAFDEFARQDPEGAIRWLAAENQVDLRQLHIGQPQISPQQRAYDERIERLESELAETKRGFTTQAHQQVVGFVSSWGTEKDSGGNVLRPHFDAVREEMALFVPALEQKYPQATPQELLDKAYRLALADRSDLQKIEQQSVEQKRIADAKAKAERARKASSSIPSSFNGNSQVVPDDLRSVIKAAVEQHRT